MVNNSRKEAGNAKKVSQMIVELAEDYIRIGDSLEKMQSYLNSACSAWNIANLPFNKRQQALESYLLKYQILNPGIDDVSNLKHDMQILIKKKLEMFPRVKKQIVDARIVEDGDEYNIITYSAQKSG